MHMVKLDIRKKGLTKPYLKAMLENKKIIKRQQDFIIVIKEK